MAEKEWMQLIYLLTKFLDCLGRSGKVFSAGIVRMVRRWARGEYYKARGTKALEKEGALPGGALSIYQELEGKVEEL